MTALEIAHAYFVVGEEAVYGKEVLQYLNNVLDENNVIDESLLPYIGPVDKILTTGL